MIHNTLVVQVSILRELINSQNTKIGKVETFPSWMEVPKFVWPATRIHPMLVEKTNPDFARWHKVHSPLDDMHFRCDL